ncbi:related to beta-keto-acyl-ACP synthase [Cephalotrichum gorgonifer]|uniref:3-oxoacyl-[acyl-carrier-protein] synthase n=1 Tax=Cephalotrichum gorgonifer TaxID=2041049 RepID=A0AAE8MV03_9PEZI|nr:related to beta-keto-acyl-ACP synthase [Cephalotrichum gorgonifer]
MRRVVVTGLGAVTPLAVGVRPTWKRLLAGETGITSVLEHREPRSQWKGIPSTVAGLVPQARDGGEKGWQGAGGENEWRASEWLSNGERDRMPRHTQFAIAASDMAFRDAGWKPLTAGEKDMTGVSMGSGIGDLEQLFGTSLAYDQGGYKKTPPLFVPRILLNMAAGHISMRHGLQGPNHCLTTACATGADSVGDAFTSIRLGRADVMLAGGTESCIHPLALAGFSRLRSLSTARNEDPGASCRPFDRDRDGFVIAEGAAALVLEELGHARARGARIYAEVRGWGSAGDAYHMTAPRADGDGALRAMRRALREAGVEAGDVDYINAHATGTRVGDGAEILAIRELMAGVGREVTVSGTKGATGHLLGASGALEAIFTVLAIHERMVPPTLNLDNPDVDGAGFNLVTVKAQRKEKLDIALSNSFGFGGANSTLVFSRLGEEDM